MHWISLKLTENRNKRVRLYVVDIEDIPFQWEDLTPRHIYSPQEEILFQSGWDTAQGRLCYCRALHSPLYIRGLPKEVFINRSLNDMNWWKSDWMNEWMNSWMNELGTEWMFIIGLIVCILSSTEFPLICCGMSGWGPRWCVYTAVA